MVRRNGALEAPPFLASPFTSECHGIRPPSAHTLEVVALSSLRNHIKAVRRSLVMDQSVFLMKQATMDVPKVLKHPFLFTIPLS